MKKYNTLELKSRTRQFRKKSKLVFQQQTSLQIMRQRHCFIVMLMRHFFKFTKKKINIMKQNFAETKDP
jgi:hypothetical protein